MCLLTKIYEKKKERKKDLWSYPFRREYSHSGFAFCGLHTLSLKYIIIFLSGVKKDFIVF